MDLEPKLKLNLTIELQGLGCPRKPKAWEPVMFLTLLLETPDVLGNQK
jgi:hypothetical protein